MRDATRPGQPPVGAGTEGSALKTLHVHATGNQTLRAPVRARAGGRRRVPGRLRWRFRVRRTGGGRRGPRRARGIRLQPRGRPWPERVGRAGGGGGRAVWPAAAAAAGRLAALDFPPFGSASGSGFGHHRGPLLLELETCATGLRITCGAWTDPLGAANELNSVQIFVETHSQFCSTTLSRRIAVRTTYVRELQYVRAGGAVEVSRFTLAVWYIRPTHRGLLLPSSIQGIRYSVH
jgi:hypothetical protein